MKPILAALCIFSLNLIYAQSITLTEIEKQVKL